LTSDEDIRGIGSDPPVTATPDVVVEAVGLLCPLPLVKVARILGALPVGALIELTSDDPAALEDVPTWCGVRHHPYAGVCRRGAVLHFYFRKGRPPAAG
jgi:TusA-related sulfurtransferase